MNKIGYIAASAALMFGIMGCNVQKEEAGAGYIGPSDIKVEDGRMTPEVMLSLGRLSDPQLSPDGEKILYGVSYTSIAENRSCRNLFTCNLDGTGKNQLTTDGKSINAAKWAKDGHSIYFLQGGQLYNAVYAEGKLGERTKLSDVAEGIIAGLLCKHGAFCGEVS